MRHQGIAGWDIILLYIHASMDQQTINWCFDVGRVSSLTECLLITTHVYQISFASAS